MQASGQDTVEPYGHVIAIVIQPLLSAHWRECFETALRLLTMVLRARPARRAGTAILSGWRFFSHIVCLDRQIARRARWAIGPIAIAMEWQDTWTSEPTTTLEKQATRHQQASVKNAWHLRLPLADPKIPKKSEGNAVATSHGYKPHHHQMGIGQNKRTLVCHCHERQQRTCPSMPWKAHIHSYSTSLVKRIWSICYIVGRSQAPCMLNSSMSEPP